MRCPNCGSLDTQVKDSRPTEDSSVIRRRRVCLTCNFRFTTFERVQLRELVVIKRNGRRVPFDRDKLLRSMQIALRKRPVEPERIDQAVSKIVRELESQGESEVSSEAVGEMVMEALRALDDVAYVRFASVYRNFREAKDFETVLDELTATALASRQSAQCHRRSDELSRRFGRLHAFQQTVHRGMECLPRRLAIALVAHDDRIAGIEALVEHVPPGEFR